MRVAATRGAFGRAAAWVRAAAHAPTPAARGPLYAAVLVVYAATWPALWGNASGTRFGAVGAAFALFVLAQVLCDRLPVAGTWVVRGSLAAQVLLVAALNGLVPGSITMVMYFIPAVRAFLGLPAHEAGTWAVALVGLIVLQHELDADPQHGVATALVFGAGFAFFGAIIASARRAQAARERSDRLLGELSAAHAQLSAAHAQLREQAAEAEAQARERSTLLAVSRTVASTLEMEPLMGTILDELKRVVDYSAASVRLLERPPGDAGAGEEGEGNEGGEEAELVMLAYRGPNPRSWRRARMALDFNPLNREVVRRRAPLLVADAHADDSPVAREYRAAIEWRDPMHDHVRSWLGVPLVVRDEVIGLIVLNHQQPHHYRAHHAETAQAFANHAAVAVDNARLYAQAQRSAAREERQRLARELHDAVTQTLFSASLIAEVLPRLWQRDPAEGQRRLEELRQLTRGALAEMRTLLLELRPAALVYTPLRDLLRQLCEAATGRARIPITLHLDAAEPPPASEAGNAGLLLPPDAQVALYRIAQEALHNVVKHAGATRCDLSLRERGAEFELRVVDDGTGFEPGAASAAHLGLRIMRERAEAVGAWLQIESRRGRRRHGTTIVARWHPADTDAARAPDDQGASVPPRPVFPPSVLSAPKRGARTSSRRMNSSSSTATTTSGST